MYIPVLDNVVVGLPLGVGVVVGGVIELGRGVVAIVGGPTGIEDGENVVAGESMKNNV